MTWRLNNKLKVTLIRHGLHDGKTQPDLKNVPCDAIHGLVKTKPYNRRWKKRLALLLSGHTEYVKGIAMVELQI